MVRGNFAVAGIVKAKQMARLEISPFRLHRVLALACAVKRLSLLAMLLAAGAVAMLAQSTGQTGTISGRVEAKDLATPVTQGWVLAFPGQNQQRSPRGYGGRIQSDGSFRIHNLPLGMYVLTARAPGYQNSDESAEPPGRRTVNLLATGAVPKDGGDLVLRLRRTGVISGTVRDEDGFPVSRANVMVFAVSKDGSRTRRAARGWSTNTDEEGRFRLGGLEAGHYFVKAQRQDAYMMQNFEDRSSPDAIPAVGARLSSAIHPSAVGPEEAQVVSVGPGEERHGVDIAFPAVLGYPISGIVRNPDGTPATGLSVGITRGSARFPWATEGSHAQVREGGRFESPPLPPGEYAVSAMKHVPQRPSEGLFAYATVALGGGPAEGVELRLEPPMQVRGTVSMPRLTRPEGVPEGYPRQLTISFVPDQANSGRFMPVQGGGQARVSESGPFTMQTVRPGRYRLEVHSPMQGWYVAEANLAGQDLLQGAATIQGAGGDLAARVVLRENAATVKGSVKPPEDGEGVGCFLRLYPAIDRSGSSPNVRQSYCDSKGEFAIPSVAPGRHKLFVFTPEELQEGDLDGLAQERWDRAPTVTAREGETVEINPEWP